MAKRGDREGKPEEEEARVLPRRIVVVAYPQAELLDVAGPCAVFAALEQVRGEGDGARADGYLVEVISTTTDLQVITSSGVGLVAHRSYARLRGSVDTLLVVGGDSVFDVASDADFLAWLRRMAPRVRRIGSVCTGAFILAAAGLLDGRRATTHWGSCGRLARSYPEVDVQADPIFRRDGHVYTSAGVTAGMDMALALVEEDHGRAVALQIARHLVMFVRRPGGQSQFSALLELQAADREPLRELQAWMAENLAADLTVEALARQMHMSPRNFARVFLREIGRTPARFVERLRVEAARRRLEESEGGLEKIACECGFGSADSMRRSFLRVLRIAPSDYRVRFRAAPAG